MTALYIENQSLIHSLNARVKLILTLVFILSLSLARSGAWVFYFFLFALVLAGVLISGVGPGRVLRRSLIAIPFALAALPLIFTGPAPFHQYAFLQLPPLEISLPGTQRALSILLKSWISVQAAILLSSTTRIPDLLAALRQMGLPALLVAILSLMLRYLQLIIDEAARMMQARASRSTRLSQSRSTGGSIAWRARVTGGMAGSLLLRSLERSERVYNAMLSRGYDGDLPAVTATPLSIKDQLILALGIISLGIPYLLSLISHG